ncbi:MAG: polyphosphate kinase 2 family protein, partial [Luteibaculum sp.]
GIDASGKDGLIQRNLEVLVLPNLRVAHFRKPSALELSHDFLWRIYQQVPKRGEIVVFNRSHYEDILVPESLGDLEHDELQGRYASIVNFEEHLLRSGIHT